MCTASLITITELSIKVYVITYIPTFSVLLGFHLPDYGPWCTGQKKRKKVNHTHTNELLPWTIYLVHGINMQTRVCDTMIKSMKVKGIGKGNFICHYLLHSNNNILFALYPIYVRKSFHFLRLSIYYLVHSTSSSTSSKVETEMKRSCLSN